MQENISERLKKLDNQKLIDIVKNYKQYGYDDELRNAAINILEMRGIDRQQLILTGNFENKEYKDVELVYTTYKKSSKTAIVLYGLLLLLKLLVPIVDAGSVAFANFLAILMLSVLVLYFVFLIKSFVAQNSFYKIIGKEFGIYGAMIYLFLGMPFYIIMYFYFRKQMNEEMKSVL